MTAILALMASEVRDQDRLVPRMIRTMQLVRVLAPRELRVRYRQSILTVAWAVITPVVILAVYGVVLTRSFGVTGGCAPYLVTAWAGLVVWTFFATALGGAVGSLVQSSDLISKLYFPREALPLATVGASLPDLAVGMVTVVIIAYIQGVRLGLVSLMVVVPLALIVLWTAALSIVVAVLATFTRDFIHGVHLALRVGFFATPVMYEQHLIPRAFAWTASWNPVAVTITAIRAAMFCDVMPSSRLLGAHLLGALAFLLAAVVYTRSVEARIVDVV